jgi:SAM-dependent methyltransferase
MATRDEVIWTYRILLNRDPENETVIAEKMCTSLSDLRRLILSSPEFQYSSEQSAGFPSRTSFIDGPSIEVDIDVDPEVLSRLIARVERNFCYLGTTEPYWSVDSQEKFRMSTVEKHKDDFYLHGMGPANDLRATLDRCNIALDAFSTCLELGCGLGRTTIWLAEMFSHVFAVDISAVHLNGAREALRERGKSNVSFLLSDTVAFYDSFPQFDVFFSIIVLQHNPPPVIAHLLRAALRKLKCNGIAYFQVPTYHPTYSFKASQYVESELQLGMPEIHLLPQPALFRILAEAGCQIIDMHEDRVAGPGWLSNRILARKS